jgi:DNA repair photolyase
MPTSRRPLSAEDHPGPSPRLRIGRGALSNPDGRFLHLQREAVDDGWSEPDELPPRLETTVLIDHAKSIISRNQSPDLPFDQSINPYRGCEHGCIYCFARPSHAYLDLSPGLDFETRLFYKPNAAQLLEAELRQPGYRCRSLSLGTNTDPYQPLERKLRVTRSILEVLARFRHPVGIVSKGAALIERDLDLLQDLARDRLVMVALSITTLDAELKRSLEPRAASPQARLRLLQRLEQAGIPTMVMVSPVIPFVNDAEIEQILTAAHAAGTRRAGYIPLRLPHEVKDLFREWLQVQVPLKAKHVMSLVQQMRGGKDNDPHFGTRMRGEGPYAEMIAQRFRLACRRLGINEGERQSLDCSRFIVPTQAGDQLQLGF